MEMFRVRFVRTTDRRQMAALAPHINSSNIKSFAFVVKLCEGKELLPRSELSKQCGGA
jgi:hypothetical protein